MQTTATIGLTSWKRARMPTQIAGQIDTDEDEKGGKEESKNEEDMDEESGYPHKEDQFSDPYAFLPGEDSDPTGDDSSSLDGKPKAKGIEKTMDGSKDSNGPDSTMLKGFVEYCKNHEKNFLPLSSQEKTSIRLMELLRNNKTPLNAFPEFLEWHLKETGEIREDETLQDTTQWCHRKALLKRLVPRYNLQDMVPKEKKVLLPSSKVNVKIPYRDAEACIVSLLTDPRFEDEDFLFWGDTPFDSPPEKVPYLEDLNTGDAYLETYKQVITQPNQVLLLVPMYIDGATTGQFTDLPITALKLTLGILKRTTRDKAHAWRELGWVPQVRKQSTRGKKILKESQHMESYDVEVEDGEGEYALDEESNEDEEEEMEDEDTNAKAQDFHTMIAAILESFVQLQRRGGFLFDLRWKGKVYPKAHIIPVVPYVKCDTEEGDLNAGKFLCRNKHVKHICRYCHTPSSEADNPLYPIKLKTQKEIQKLVERKKLKKLQAISQQYINNAWYKVSFHKANECGIHGACPSEMLHAILLGIFKYVRDVFFDTMGNSSQLAQDIDGLAKEYGTQFSRQSQRDKPKTGFTKGISQGKLMGTEYRGVLLIMAAVLRSTAGRSFLMKKKRFGKETGLADWTMLVKLLLEWEAYLCEKKMKREHVKKMKTKNKVLMHLLKQVARRTQGNQWKLMKFHAILHLTQDILLFGVPYEFDTSSNESHHKPSKDAAKLTQRKESTFNIQTAIRMTEFLAIALAIHEIAFDARVWDYYVGATVWEGPSEDGDTEDKERNPDDLDSDQGEAHEESRSKFTKTGGGRIVIYEDSDDDNKPAFKFKSRSSALHLGSTTLELGLIDFLFDLQKLVISYIPQKELPIYCKHKRDDVIWHAHPNYRGSGPWRDWAIVDWGPEGHLPCKIWCFVELNGLPKGKLLKHGGVSLRDGTYAVVESAIYVPEDDGVLAEFQSDFFTPIEVESQGKLEEGGSRVFYLADVEAFTKPIIVIPDIGGLTNRYFVVKKRSEWKDEFVKWLKQPHALDAEMVEDE
ncbi:MAG: hypothetical protein AAF587_43840 [Bacteroidota bacterium]